MKYSKEEPILTALELEELEFKRDTQFSPLLYMDALSINGHFINGEPRIEASIKAGNEHKLIDYTTALKYCKQDTNQYHCKNPSKIHVKRNQVVLLEVIRRYRLNELTTEEKVIKYNRQLWRPTERVEVAVSNNILTKYEVRIEVQDYNGDLVDVNILPKQKKNGDLVYVLTPRAGRPGRRFYIMDKIIVVMEGGAQGGREEPYSGDKKEAVNSGAATRGNS